MTREEAKKRLEVWLKCGECPEDKRCYDSYLHSTCEYTDYCDEVSIGESIKVAIKALEQELCDDDVISRQQAIDKMQELEDEDIKAYSCKIPEGFDGKRAIEALKALPSVTPQQKTGHWIYFKAVNTSEIIWSECSECKDGERGCAKRMKYCPNCGAKMVEPQEGSGEE